jgi:phosphate transport system substrate-binding protein
MFLYTIVILASLVDILRDPFWQVWGGIIISVIVGIGGIVVPIIRERPPRKLVTHQLLSDAPILSVHRGLQQRLQILFDNNRLQDPRLIVLKVRNSGKDLISDQDYRPAPQFLFPRRELLSSEVIETKPSGILNSQNLVIHRGSLETEEPGSIELPPIPLNRKDSITLNALLIGPGEESGKSYDSIGRILGGDFLAYEPKRGLSRRTLAFVIPSVFLIGIILTATLLARFITPQPADCVSGTLNIGGSTAMYPLVFQVGQKYQARCSGVVISVNQNVVGSDSGLIEVENGGIHIGDSDIPAQKDK